jgi:outer membrane protein TolC
MSAIAVISLSSVTLIATVVTVVFAFYARRSALPPWQRDPFARVIAAALFGWLGVAGLLALTGILQATASQVIPTTGFALLAALTLGLLALFGSAPLRTVVNAVPLAWLVGIQLYRVVGLLFLVLYAAGQMPGAFAIPAGVGDAIVGAAAPIVAYALHRHRPWAATAAVVWNVFGIVDLVVAVGTGVLTSPGPLQGLAFERPNGLITAFPFVLVPVFVVPLSVLLHIVALRRLSGADGRSTMRFVTPADSARRVAGLWVFAFILGGPSMAQEPRDRTLPLTLDEAVARAIRNNPDLAIVRLGTEVEAARVGESLGAFVPVFSTQFGRSNTATPPSNSLAGDAGISVDDWFSSTGVRQRLPWGSGTWSASWETTRSSTDSPLTSFDSSVQSGLQVAFSQPLLRDRKIDPARHQLALARRNQISSDLRFREAAAQTTAAVKQAYWTLKAARANVTVQERSLALAQELARENRVRVDAGQIPPLDLLQAEAEVARRRENLIRAATTAADAEDALRRLIIDPGDPSFWQVRLDPVEQPTSLAALPDIDVAVTRALDQRYDLARAGHDLENATTTVKFLDNQRLPDVRVEASYRSDGLSGTQFLRAGGFPGSISGTRRLGFGDSLGQILGGDYATWSFGLTLNYPIGRSFERASYARADVERRQAAQRIASLQLEAAESVRRAGRQIQSTAERVEAARAGATLAEQRLQTEQRRFEAGLSTTFLVTQAQRDLLEAEVNLLQTTLDFESAIVAFEALQVAPARGNGDSGARGTTVVQLPTPAPNGIFRSGGSAGF